MQIFFLFYFGIRVIPKEGGWICFKSFGDITNGIRASKTVFDIAKNLQAIICPWRSRFQHHHGFTSLYIGNDLGEVTFFLYLVWEVST